MQQRNFLLFSVFPFGFRFTTILRKLLWSVVRDSCHSLDSADAASDLGFASVFSFLISRSHSSYPCGFIPSSAPCSHLFLLFLFPLTLSCSSLSTQSLCQCHVRGLFGEITNGLTHTEQEYWYYCFPGGGSSTGIWTLSRLLLALVLRVWLDQVGERGQASSGETGQEREEEIRKGSKLAGPDVLHAWVCLG